MQISGRKKRNVVGSFSLLAVLSVFSAGCGDDDSAHHQTLRILVTNDDGYGAEGIDAIVAALVADPDNEVVVSAPSGNRSGSGDFTGPSERCGDLTVTQATTRSGYPATSINGCPADAVNYALDSLYPADTAPNLVISGINEGQNISQPVVTRLSGTVGAARVAARRGYPAVAASQGIPTAGNDYDYPSGVAAVLDWVDENRDSLQPREVKLPGDIIIVLPPTPRIININVPSCAPGSTIRGKFSSVPLARNAVGVLDTQDCNSTFPPQDVTNDVEAFRIGFITQTLVPFDNE